MIKNNFNILMSGLLLIGLLCLTGLAIAQTMDFSSPEATFRSYMYACQLQDFELSDRCYTKAFQHFAKTNTRYASHRHKGQLSNAYRYWANKKYTLEMHGNKAIMQFSPEGVRPEPFYFVKEEGEWKIDGMFSFENVVIQDSQTWFWRNGNVDNEKEWLNR